MGRCTELLTLYFQQPCLMGQEPYAEIRRVRSHQRERLSWSKGNVNLTDYWYTMVDAFMTQDIAYTGQHIDLLCDNESLWWQEQIDAGRSWMCLCFIKWKKDCEKSREKEAELQRDAENHRFFRTFGNADCIYAFSAENRKGLLEELEKQKEDRPLFFSSYYLYGQCRLAEANLWKIEPYEIADGGGMDGHILYEGGWSMQTITKLREAVRENKENKNKKMVAYYQALGQIVNIVAQYEQSPVFKDLFYMFYPPIALFWDQLKQAEKEIATLQEKIQGRSGKQADTAVLTAMKHVRMRKEENSISEFIDSIETLLHHMGHSCRDILSEAGRGGIPYDIPIHLCMMYMAYLYAFTKIINDGGYRFEYCPVPLASSRPVTRYFDFGLAPTDRLIRVQISRHMMFMPRSLLIILGHEVSHYVSEVPRHRQLRAQCCINIVNKVIAMRLIPDDFLEILNITGTTKEMSFLENYLDETRNRVYAYLQDNIWKKWDMENQGADRYHFSNFLDSLERVCREVLIDEEESLRWNLEFIDAKTIKALRESNSLYQNIVYVQSILNERKVLLWEEDPKLREFLWEVFSNLREAYADLLSVSVLDVAWKEFIEAYVISESYVPDEDSLASSLVNRYAIVKYLLEEDKKDGWSGSMDALTSEHDLSGNEMDAFLNMTEQQVNEYLADYCREDSDTGIRQNAEQMTQSAAEQREEAGACDSRPTDLFYYREVIEEEIDYLRSCYEDIKKMISTEANDDVRRIKLIRNLYQHFLVKEQGEDSSYQDFFGDCNKLIELYKESTAKKYEQ